MAQFLADGQRLFRLNSVAQCHLPILITIFL